MFRVDRLDLGDAFFEERQRGAYSETKRDEEGGMDRWGGREDGRGNRVSLPRRGGWDVHFQGGRLVRHLVSLLHSYRALEIASLLDCTVKAEKGKRVNVRSRLVAGLLNVALGLCTWD